MILKILQTAIPFVWFGLVAAISFLEAPLKFRAPGITLPLGLGIGKIVFRALNRIEIALAALMIVSLYSARPAQHYTLYVFGAICILLILQTVWLLPHLTSRAEQVIAGIAAPRSNNHLFFIAFEALKVLLLLILGVGLLQSNLRFE